MKQTLIALALCCYASAAAAADYIVVFKAPSTKGQSHKQQVLGLKDRNQKNITLLSEKAKTEGGSFKINQNLWFIQSVAITANKSVRDRIAKHNNVEAILLDRDRQLINPPAVQPSMLNADPEKPSWALNYLGIDSLRKERPELMGSGIKVGILDTGIQDRHPEFDLHGDRVVFKDFVNNLKYPYDDNGHGTHVAGIVSGKTMGVAPSVSIIAGKIIAAEGYSRDSWALAGMQWMFDPDGDENTADFPRIINNSWGFPLPVGEIYEYDFLPYVRAIKAWVNTGIVPVFAVGNKGKAQPDFPAAMLETIAVGGINEKAELAPFSNYGPATWITFNNMFTVNKPDVTAPATNINAAMINNIFKEMTGTSMAAPFVTGSLALLFQNHPLYDTLEAKLRLYKTVTPKRDRYQGFGILDTKKLVEPKNGTTMESGEQDSKTSPQKPTEVPEAPMDL